MKLIGAGTLPAIFLMAVPAAVPADPMPTGAQTPSLQKVEMAYTGKTDLWQGECDGGIYYASGGQVRAWCAQNSESLGAGTWRVEPDGRMCFQLTWYWREGDETKAATDETECISHVVTRGGKLWRNWPENADWWPLDRYSGLVRGYEFMENVRRTREVLGFSVTRE